MYNDIYVWSFREFFICIYIRKKLVVICFYFKVDELMIKKGVKRWVK